MSDLITVDTDDSGPAGVLARIAQIQARIGIGLGAQGGVMGLAGPSSGTGSSASSGFATSLAAAKSTTNGTQNTGATGNTGKTPNAGDGDDTTDPIRSAVGAAAVSLARSYTGVPYLWGGTNPKKGLDCSGLVQLVYQRLGVDLPRTSQQQAKVGTAVSSVAQAKPGDLVFFGSPVHHVGIYIGDGSMIDAPHRGATVGVHKLYGTPSHIRRVSGLAPVGGNAGATSLGDSTLGGSGLNSSALSSLGLNSAALTGTGLTGTGLTGTGLAATINSTIAATLSKALLGTDTGSGASGASSSGGTGDDLLSQLASALRAQQTQALVTALNTAQGTAATQSPATQTPATQPSPTTAPATRHASGATGPSGRSGSSGSSGLATSVPYADLFVAAGHKYGVDPALLASVAKAESGFNPKAKSPVGAQGLMQLMPGTARELGVDPSRPAQAIDGAARLLSGYLKRYDGSIPKTLAAYNAGPGAVAHYGGVPPYAETRHYVSKVTTYLKELS